MKQDTQNINFSGRVLLTIKNGVVINTRNIKGNEHVAMLPEFLEIARMSGYSVTQVKSSKAATGE